MPEYCRATPADLVPFFREPGLVDHQHPGRVAEVLDHVVPHVVADRVGVPVRLVSSRCIPSGIASPACSANVQEFFFSSGANSPRT